MRTEELKPGDQVLYRDLDEIHWGPWTVSDVSDRIVTVRIEDSIVCIADPDFLEKVETEKEAA